MEVKGKLIKVLQAEAGTSKSGKAWSSQICLVETDAKYNPIIAVKAMGDDKIKQMNKLEVGMIVAILCNVYSREYNGKYYNSIDGYHFSNMSGVGADVDFVTSDEPF